jgi:hypothetical protein
MEQNSQSTHNTVFDSGLAKNTADPFSHCGQLLQVIIVGLEQQGSTLRYLPVARLYSCTARLCSCIVLENWWPPEPSPLATKKR